MPPTRLMAGRFDPASATTLAYRDAHKHHDRAPATTPWPYVASSPGPAVDMLPVLLIDASIRDLEALGFELGEIDAGDPMFRPARLPDGWTREPVPLDRAGVYLLDDLGRRRLIAGYSTDYKRPAYLRLFPLSHYLADCQIHNRPVVTDPHWATPTATAAAARVLAEDALTGLLQLPEDDPGRTALRAAAVWHTALHDHLSRADQPHQPAAAGIVWRYRPPEAPARPKPAPEAPHEA